VARETGLKSARAVTATSDQKLADLKADAGKLTVRAPADGVICYGQFSGGAFTGADSRALRIGEHVAPQQVAMTFYVPGKMRVRLELPETKFFDLRPGMPAKIEPAAFPDLKLVGRCDAAPALPVATQQGPVYAMTLSIPDVDPRISPGIRATVHAESVEAHDVLLVPSSAIADGFVWIKTRDGTRQRRHVETGKSDGKNTEIKRGLEEGDELFR